MCRGRSPQVGKILHDITCPHMLQPAKRNNNATKPEIDETKLTGFDLRYIFLLICAQTVSFPAHIFGLEPLKTWFSNSNSWPNRASCATDRLWKLLSTVVKPTRPIACQSCFMSSKPGASWLQTCWRPWLAKNQSISNQQSRKKYGIRHSVIQHHYISKFGTSNLKIWEGWRHLCDPIIYQDNPQDTDGRALMEPQTSTWKRGLCRFWSSTGCTFYVKPSESLFVPAKGLLLWSSFVENWIRKTLKMMLESLINLNEMAWTVTFQHLCVTYYNQKLSESSCLSILWRLLAAWSLSRPTICLLMNVLIWVGYGLNYGSWTFSCGYGSNLIS